MRGAHCRNGEQAARTADASDSEPPPSARYGQNDCSTAVGRKNHYGSKSQRGTEVAALYYSLVESAKLTGVDPGTYLEEAARRAIATPGTATLPHELA